MSEPEKSSPLSEVTDLAGIAALGGVSRSTLHKVTSELARAGLIRKVAAGWVAEASAAGRIAEAARAARRAAKK